jgi:hypothetical protein
MSSLLWRFWTGRASAWLVVLAVGLSAPAAAGAAQTRVYQWHEVNGTEVMSNMAPPPDIKDYSVHDVHSAALSAKQRAEAAQRLAQDRAALTGSVASPSDDIAAARAQLAQARHERDIGREPLPGERAHNAQGGSRLTPAYFERQAKLESAVSKAEQELSAAYRQRSEALQ